MKLPVAPAHYARSLFQPILSAIEQGVNGCFARGQDVRLVNGERFSLASAGGIETFLTVDDAGNLLAAMGRMTPTVSAAGTLTIAEPGLHVFSGSTATWTLPPVAASAGWLIFLKNRGSGALTIQRAGADQIYANTPVSSIAIAAGASGWLINDGSYWDAEWVRAAFG